MHKIEIMSKKKCTIFSTRDLKEDCVIVSINCPREYTTILKNKNILDICILNFDDIEESIDDLKLMSYTQAKKIKDFIDRYKDKVNHIVIHCAAGISRSAAVGCVIARYLNGDDDYLWASGRYLPNKHVYKMMCLAFNIKFDEDDFNQKLKLRHEKLDKNRMINFVTEDDMLCDVIIE